jgi:hypothetical protein
MYQRNPVMRKLLKSSFFVFLILVFPVSLVIGQDHKSEQKIKIIVDEGSGKKVVVDTVFKNNTVPDSLILKDRTVILIKHPGNGSVIDKHNGKDHFFVTYSSTGKDEGKDYKEVTVIASDSLNINEPDKNGDVYLYSNSDSEVNNEGSGGKNYRIITRKSHINGENADTIYIKTSEASDDANDKTFDVYVSDGDKDSKVEKSRYVIAKDGMVVTIEGGDEAKTKELVREIKAKMGVKDDEQGKKEMVKSETKKTSKK